MAALKTPQTQQQQAIDSQKRPHHKPQPQPAAIWEKPTTEEFDLCFEITAYVYHW